MLHCVDHEQEAKRIELELFQKMSAARKYALIVELRAFAWKVKRAGIKAAHPEWSSEQIESAVREAFLYART
jgi:hypothetical protein